MAEFDDIEVWGTKEKTSSTNTTEVVDDHKSKKGLLIGLLALLFAAAGGAALYAFVLDSDTDSANTSADEASDKKDGSESNSESDLTDSNLRDNQTASENVNVGVTQLVDADATALAERADKSGAWIASKEGLYSVDIRGVVATEEQKAEIEGLLGGFYLEHFKSDISVDPAVADDEYINATQGLLVHTASLVSNGGFVLDKNGLYQEGDFYNQDDLDIFNTVAQSELKAQLDGLGVEMAEENHVIKPIIPHTIGAKRADKKVTVFGSVPSQEVVDIMYNAALAVYPESEVTNEIKIDPTTAGGFAIPQYEALIATYSALTEYEFGIENDAFYSDIEAGATFESGSATLTGQGLEFLQAFAEFTAPLELSYQFIGHTDSAGSDETNKDLSERRAEAVATIFREVGIPDEFITVQGEGESKPVASNDTAEGKARNRRVEVKLIAAATES